MQSPNNKLKKIIVPVAILLVTFIVAKLILSNPPTSKRRAPSTAPQMTVEVMKLEPKMYQINLDSFGTVMPSTQSNLVSQVNGEITYVSENFSDGGFFTKGEVLLKVDDRDYRSDVKIAKASLLDAQQALTEEKARSSQALADWKRLGKQGEPNSLVLRKPQLEAAKARLFSAEAQHEKAQLKLERANIVAPYSGRVLSQKVDLGQVISANTQLATIFATDFVEIRLPLKNQDLPLIDLPEAYRDQESPTLKSNVVFTSSFNAEQQWVGELIRTESAIDTNSQQLYVVAQIEDPYTNNNDGLSIKIGQYLQANIAGKLIPNAIVIPNNAIYQGTYVYVVEENLLKRRDVEVLWKNETDVVVKSGLNSGEQIVLTPLGRVSSGTPVSIAGAEKKSKKARGKFNKDEKGAKRKKDGKKGEGKPPKNIGDKS